MERLNRYRLEFSRQLREREGLEIIEATACPDHIHMLVSISAKLSVSSFVGYLKGRKRFNEI